MPTNIVVQSCCRLTLLFAESRVKMSDLEEDVELGELPRLRPRPSRLITSATPSPLLRGVGRGRASPRQQSTSDHRSPFAAVRPPLAEEATDGDEHAQQSRSASPRGRFEDVEFRDAAATSPARGRRSERAFDAVRPSAFHELMAKTTLSSPKRTTSNSDDAMLPSGRNQGQQPLQSAAPPVVTYYTDGAIVPTRASVPTAPPSMQSVSRPQGSVLASGVAISDAGPGLRTEGRERPTPTPRQRYPIPPLPNFSGEGSVEDFISRFENHAKHCQWTEEERSFHLRNSLQGVAAQVLWRLAEHARSEEVLSRLRTRFGQPHQEQRFRAELKARRRRPGESIQSLANELYYLAERGYPKERDDEAWSDILKDIFITALNDPKLRMEVLMRQPKNMDEAADIATQIEAFATVARIDVTDSTSAEPSSAIRRRGDQQVRSVQPSASPQPTVDSSLSATLQRMEKSVEQTLASMDRRIRQIEERAAAPNRSSFSSTPVTTSDHRIEPLSAPTQRGQPARRGGGRSGNRPPRLARADGSACYNCGATDGHWARDCPHPKKDQAPARAAANQAKETGGPRAVYTKAILYKRTIPVLFDSGCDRTVIQSRYLPPDLKLQPVTGELCTADNTPIPLLGSADIDFVIDGHPFSANVAVSPSIDGLFLGSDWMEKNDAVLKFKEHQIVIGGRVFALHARPEAGQTR